ncbi:unnamed protein product [Rhodiola kirilowii]
MELGTTTFCPSPSSVGVFLCRRREIGFKLVQSLLFRLLRFDEFGGRWSRCLKDIVIAGVRLLKMKMLIHVWVNDSDVKHSQTLQSCISQSTVSTKIPVEEDKLVFACEVKDDVLSTSSQTSYLA